jgi:hypothetical protein
MKLIPMQSYRVELPRYKFPQPLTYMGLANGDYRCMVCEREGGTRAGWSNRHSFVEGDPDNPTDQVIVGTECIKKCKITPESATEGRMGTMKDVFEAIDEAVARGKGEHTWKDERRKGSDHGTQRLYNKYGDVVAEVVWFDIDEGKDKFVASVATPGVRGNPTQIGRFTSLDKAKASVEKELGL